MTRTHQSEWLSNGEEDRQDTPKHSSEDFNFKQKGKPLKAVIGVAVLVVLALVLSRMDPAPHDAQKSSITTGQTTGTGR